VCVCVFVRARGFLCVFWGLAGGRWAKCGVVYYNMGSCMSSTQAVKTGNLRGKQMNNGSRRQRKKELRRQALETLSVEAKNDEILATIPGRTCSNGASNISCIYTQQGRKGTNQDAMIVWEVGFPPIVFFGYFVENLFWFFLMENFPFGMYVPGGALDDLPLSFNCLRLFFFPSFCAGFCIHGRYSVLWGI
jgi:hypothetical protein